MAFIEPLFIETAPELRGTGRTTRLIENAPHSALFICQRGLRAAFYHAVRELGRSDLMVSSVGCLEYSFSFVGTYIPAIVFDHDVFENLTPLQLYNFQCLQSTMRFQKKIKDAIHVFRTPIHKIVIRDNRVSPGTNS